MLARKSDAECFWNNSRAAILWPAWSRISSTIRRAEPRQIFATDFQVGEAVKFQVLHNDGIPNTGNGHEPWTVTDGGPGDLDGLVNGNIHTTWYVDPDDSLGSTFELSALGLSSGLYDTHEFTDGPPSPGQLNQWDPGNAPDKDWVSGNNDGPDYEGDIVPYYITLEDLIVGNVYQVTIGFDTTKSGKHAFDYLETYDETIAFPPAVDPAVDAGLIADPTPDLLPIPLDPDVPVGIQQPGDFTMYYGDMTGTSAYARPAPAPMPVTRQDASPLLSSLKTMVSETPRRTSFSFGAVTSPRARPGGQIAPR